MSMGSNYPALTRRFTASSTSTGSMAFKMDEVGFFTDTGREHVYVLDTPIKTWNVRLGGAATVVIEGNDGDPDVAAEWYQISSVTSSSNIKTEDSVGFMRSRVDAYTSGSVDVEFAGLG